MKIDHPTLAKYAAGAALIGSVFYLVLIDKASIELYVGLVTAALAALGINAATGGQQK